MSRADRRVFSIPAGTGFLDALAEGVIAETGGDPLALSGYRILLPTRRACRALQEAFLRLSGGRPLLLPRLEPLAIRACTRALSLSLDSLAELDAIHLNCAARSPADCHR